MAPKFPALLLLGVLAVGVPSAGATTFEVLITTSVSDGLIGSLALDFISASPPTNSVTISQLLILGGQFSTPVFSGSASGDLSTGFALDDGSFFNEVLLPTNIGKQISFNVDITNIAPTPPSALPDSLTVFLLDSVGDPLFQTSDPSGSNALLEFDCGSSNAQSFTDDVTITNAVTSVPEPKTVLLIFGGLVPFVIKRRFS